MSARGDGQVKYMNTRRTLLREASRILKGFNVRDRNRIVNECLRSYLSKLGYVPAPGTVQKPDGT